MPRCKLQKQRDADVVLSDEEGDIPVCDLVVRGHFSTDENPSRHT